MVGSIRVRSRAVLAWPLAIIGVVGVLAFAAATSDVGQAAEAEASVRTDEAVFAALDTIQAERAVVRSGIGAGPRMAATDEAVDAAIAALAELESLRSLVENARTAADAPAYAGAVARILELPVRATPTTEVSIDRRIHAVHRLANIEDHHIVLAELLGENNISGAAAQRLRIDVLVDDYRTSATAAQRFSIDSALASVDTDELSVAGALALATELGALRTETLSSARSLAADDVADAAGRRWLYAALGVLGVVSTVLLGLVADRSLAAQLRNFAGQPSGTEGREHSDEDPGADADVLRVVAGHLEPSHPRDTPPLSAAFARAAPPVAGGASPYVSREAAIRLGLDPRSTRAKLAEFHDDDAPAIDGQPALAGLPAV